jgi:hypothetical protein
MKGIFSWKNGDIYAGDIKDDAANGFGIYKFKDGQKYEGEFKNDKKDGKGIYSYYFIFKNYWSIDILI